MGPPQEVICGTLYRLQQHIVFSRFAHCKRPKNFFLKKDLCGFWDDIMMTPEILAAKATCSYMNLDQEEFENCVVKAVGEDNQHLSGEWSTVQQCICDADPFQTYIRKPSNPFRPTPPMFSFCL